MAQTWPASLPQYALVSDYSETPRDGRITFQPDRGPPQVRAATQAAGYDVQVKLLMTDTQLNTFLTFFHDTLVEGSDIVTWIDFRTANAAAYLILTYETQYNVAFISGELAHYVILTMFKY